MWVGRIFVESVKDVCVFVIVVEVNMIMNFRKFIEEIFYKVDYFLVYVMFGDGVVVLIFGVDFKLNYERLFYEMYWFFQMVIEGSVEVIVGIFSDVGLVQSLQKNVVLDILGKYLKGLVLEGMEFIGFFFFIDMFWVVYFGVYRILEVVLEMMDIKKEKFQLSWDILCDFGNILSFICLFVLDEMRKYLK